MMTNSHLTCADCDELFLDYFEGELDQSRRAMVDAHASSCARCQGLIRDIQGITATAANLPDLEPSRDLWKGVEDRIQPRVVSIGYRREGIHLSSRVIGIAAAALIAVSSSITYVATRPDAPVQVTEAPRDVPINGATNEVGPQPSAPTIDETPAVVEAPAVSERAPETAKPAPQRTNVGRTIQGSPRNAALATNRPVSATDIALAPEIAELQRTLRDRRDQLDPSTIKVVEENLALIDAAVKQAREALLRDKASGFLTERLDNALQKKVELLRTVALLPSRS